MTTPELIAYIKNELSYGSTQDVIAKRLKMEGWVDDDIIEAFSLATNKVETVTPVEPVEDIVAPSSSPLPQEKIINEAISGITKPAFAPVRKSNITTYLLIAIALIVAVLIGLAIYKPELFGNIFNSQSQSKPEATINSNNNNPLMPENKQVLPNNNQQHSSPLVNSGDLTDGVSIQENIDSNGSTTYVNTDVSIGSEGSAITDNTPYITEAEPTKEYIEDSSKQNILTNMRAAAEVYHDDVVGNYTYKGFCRDKTIGAYPLAITLPKDSIYKCNDSSNEWAAWVKLSDGKYWCNDSKNYANTSTGTPFGTSCF